MRLAALQPARPARWPAYGAHPPVGRAPRGRVALHLGCVARLVDPGVLAAAVRLLNAAGYQVEVPPGQGCCGAIHLHAGATAAARALAKRNGAAFGDLGAEAVVSCVSGCGAVLSAYPLAGSGRAGELGAPVWDVSGFLLDHGVRELSFRALAARVQVHDPCTLRNVMGQHGAVYDLLSLIPGLEVAPLEGNETCCGSAGTHLLRQPATADRLAGDKLAAARAARADYVATSNVGCALNLRLNQPGGAGPEVLHPVELLARQLGP